MGRRDQGSSPSISSISIGRLAGSFSNYLKGVNTMLTGMHILLTYSCTDECDHCFLYSHPKASGSFTHHRLQDLFLQLEDVVTLEWIFFEGGEPFLFYPLLLEGLKRASAYRRGIVTNAYWATTLNDALLWLRPLRDAGLVNLTVSDDPFHNKVDDMDRASHALEAAKELGIEGERITLERPTVENDRESGVMFRGRAAHQLIEGLPKERGRLFTSCPHENLQDPDRLHVDPYGNIHLCQGLLIGNNRKRPIYQLLNHFDPKTHPVVSPLLSGGPAQLAREEGLEEGEYVDACHLCFEVRRLLLDRYPQYLGPRQVYGM